MVTGATAGIGRSFAESLARDGFRLVLVGRRCAALQSLAARLPGEHVVMQADLRAAEDVARLVAWLSNHRVGLLVNNAGGGCYGTFHQTAEHRQRELVAVNCGALTTLAHAFLSQAQRGDCLIKPLERVGLLASADISGIQRQQGFRHSAIGGPVVRKQGPGACT